ncbi:PAS domain-containing protein [Spirosoma areae]
MLSTTVLSDTALLQALLKDSLNGLILYQIVYDALNKPVDFQYQLVNPAAAALLGASQEDLLGRSCKDVFPQGDELRSYYQQVAITGQKMRVEYQLPKDGRWFEVLITEQAKETLLCFFTDITERVQVEQELIKSLTLLQQTEELAAIGSWDYDRAMNRFFWSEGMYRMFGLESGTPISHQTYLDYAIEADRPVAGRFVEQLKQGNLPLEEVVRIRRYDEVCSIRLKGVVKPDDQGQPAWVLGVCWDITEQGESVEKG